MPSISAELSHKVRRDGTKEIKIRVIHNRVPTRFSLDIFILEKYWNAKTREVKQTHPQANDINDTLRALLTRCNAYKVGCLRDGKLFTVDGVRHALFPFLEAPTPIEAVSSFTRFATDHVTHLKQIGERRNAVNYERAARSVGEAAGQPDVSFKDLTPALLVKVEKYLTAKGNSQKTVAQTMGSIRALVKLGRAQLDDVLALPNPFERYKIKVPKRKKTRKGLEREQFAKVAALPLEPGTPVFEDRQAWLLQLYLQGMRVSDVVLRSQSELVKRKVRVGDRNVTVTLLPYEQYKTGQATVASVPPQAQAIIDYFVKKYKESNGFILPYVNSARVARGIDKRVDENDKRPLKSEILEDEIHRATAKINYSLSKIAEMVGLPKKLTTHVARYTYSNFCEDSRIGNSDISKLIGHESERTTREHYLHGALDAASLLEFQQKVYGT